MLIKILSAFQTALNRLAEHPLSLGVAVGFLIGWTTLAMLSKGSFDPGLGIENLIINGLSILLLFAANSNHADHKEANAEIKSSLEQLHNKVDDL